MPKFTHSLATLLLSMAVIASAFAEPAASTPLRHYDLSKAASASVPLISDTSPEGALTFDPGPGGQAWETVPGRGPGQKALRLDQGAMVGTPFPIARAFTVALWCRSNGLGSGRGNSGATNGMLAAAGDGYWHGWRLTVAYPEARIGFEIGRPQPSSSVNISGGALATGAWQHVAASWDGKTMRLFINGLPVASGPYDGDYAPPVGGQLRIGFAGSGIGSLRLDVAEMTAYDQALDPLALLEMANVPVPLPESFRAPFEQALNVRLNGDFPASAVAFRSLLTQAGLPAAYRTSARLGLADALRGMGEPYRAAAEYAALVQAADVSEISQQSARAALLTLIAAGSAGNLPPSLFQRLLALPGMDAAQQTALRLDYARALRSGRAYPAAREQYERLLAASGLSKRDRWDAELERIGTLTAGGDLNAARMAADTLAHTPGIPAPYGSIALLSFARRAAEARKYALARAVYREVETLPNAPAHHIWEARQGEREVNRLAGGKPANNPADSRTQLPPEPKPAALFYVAPGGSDANPGTKARPFSALARARDAVRALRHLGRLPRGGVKIIVRGGEYPLVSSVVLTAEDSGTADAPVVYAAAVGETPIFTSAVRLSGFGPVQNPAILARLPAGVRSHVLQADLKRAGVKDFGQLQPHGFGHKAVPIAELFWNGKPLTLARWPNTGFVQTGKVTDTDIEGATPHGIEFEYPGKQPEHWAEPELAFLYGYWYWDWADENLQVASIDPAVHRLRTATASVYGVRSGQRFYAYNVLEELDSPGEWYLDRKTGLLLFYPPGDLASADVRFSALDAPLITMTSTSHVTLRGLTLEGGRGAGVTITGGDHCLLAACAVRRCGGDAIVIDGGTNDGVLGCDLYTLGRGGVRMTGGDRKTLTPGGHFVENCDIHDFSRLDRTYTPAVLIEGDGNRIAHCRFHDAPHHAIRLEGNDHLIEFNEIDHVVTEADDQGGFDEWSNPSYRGNILRENYWHDIGSGLTAVGQSGIRLDDAISGTLIYGNVFARCSGGNFGGVQMNGGKDNWIDNNIFVDCNIAISGGFWGGDGWAHFLHQSDTVEAVTKTVDVHSPPYSVRYPELAHLEATTGFNHVWRNTAVNCRRFLAGSSDSFDAADNFLTGSAAAAPPSLTGFAPIPLSEMGLYRDANRASWPAPQTTP